MIYTYLQIRLPIEQVLLQMAQCCQSEVHQLQPHKQQRPAHENVFARSHLNVLTDYNATGDERQQRTRVNVMMHSKPKACPSETPAQRVFSLLYYLHLKGPDAST